MAQCSGWCQEPQGSVCFIHRSKTPLHLYELGGDRWVETGRWPIRGSQVRTLFFRQGRTGTVASLNDGGRPGERDAL